MRTIGPARRVAPFAIFCVRPVELAGWQIVELVIVVINDCVPPDIRMLIQPGGDLIPAGALGQIGHTSAYGIPQYRALNRPAGSWRQSEMRTTFARVRATSFLNLRRSCLSATQVPGIGRFKAIEDPVDVEKNNPLWRRHLCGNAPGRQWFVSRMEQNLSAKVLRKPGAETCTSYGLLSLASSQE